MRDKGDEDDEDYNDSDDDDDDDPNDPKYEKVIAKWIWDTTEEPDDENMKVLVAVALAEGIVTCFSNHTYEFNGEVYLQLD